MGQREYRTGHSFLRTSRSTTSSSNSPHKRDAAELGSNIGTKIAYDYPVKAVNKKNNRGVVSTFHSPELSIVCLIPFRGAQDCTYLIIGVLQ